MNAKNFYNVDKTPEGRLRRTRIVRKPRSASQRSVLYILSSMYVCMYVFVCLFVVCFFVCLSSYLLRDTWTDLNQICVSHTCWSTTMNKEYLREMIILTKDMWLFQNLPYKPIHYIRFFHLSECFLRLLSLVRILLRLLSLGHLSEWFLRLLSLVKIVFKATVTCQNPNKIVEKLWDWVNEYISCFVKMCAKYTIMQYIHTCIVYAYIRLSSLLRLCINLFGILFGRIQTQRWKFVPL